MGRIYTRKGDDGSTGRADGTRVTKFGKLAGRYGGQFSLVPPYEVTPKTIFIVVVTDILSTFDRIITQEARRTVPGEPEDSDG